MIEPITASPSLIPDPTLYCGRPPHATGRLPKEMAVYDLLDQLSIPYHRLDHLPLDTIEACHAADGLLGTEICKNLFLCNRNKTAFYLLMMPGNKRFRTNEFSAKIGSSRLSFASPADLETLLQLTPGSVSVLGLMNDKEGRVKLCIDEDVLAHPFVGCHPCINTSSLRISTRDLTDVFLPAINHPFTTVALGTGTFADA